MLTYSLADYLGPHNIRVNAIHPGSIDTGIIENDSEDINQSKNLIPSGRIGQPEDVANVALFLGSYLSSYVNGESILVDGGYTNTGAPRWDVKDLQ
jgi:NAD(P)-dependent dehydrogenase (short-subunit alcohol dehydrogenase family)